MFPFRSHRAQKNGAEPFSAPVEVEDEALLPAPSLGVRVATRSDVGCVRELNEDSVRVSRPDSPQALARKGVLLVVADGMGGHAGGEVASLLAIETIEASYFASRKEPTPALQDAIGAANAAIHAQAKRHPELHGMGTTSTTLVLRDTLAFYAHVGDSRLYLVRGGGIYQMSEDHSAVMEMVRRGLLSSDEARVHPQKNVVLRAVGTQPHVEVSGWDEPFPLRAGDKWLLCSDGLSDLVRDEELARAADEHGLEEAAASLIALARSRGGHDNISVILAEVVPVGETATETDRTQGALVDTREVNIL